MASMIVLSTSTRLFSGHHHPADNGNTLVNRTHGNITVEFDGQGKKPRRGSTFGG